MDHPENNLDAFSRGGTPPVQSQQFYGPYLPQGSYSQPSHVSPAASLQDHVHSSSPNQIDSLFHNLSVPPVSGSGGGGGPIGGPSESVNSAPATPLSSMTATSGASAPSAASASAAGRQNALRTLLGTVSSSAPQAPAGHPSGSAGPQQIPTPPGSAPRAGPSSDSPGQYLLEQLLAGTAPRSNHGESQPNLLPPLRLSPQYLSSPLEVPSQHGYEPYDNQGVSYNPHEAVRDTSLPPQPPQVPQSHQPQPPSPGRGSMFDFVSPFDAFGPATSSSAKKKPGPQQPPSDDSWTSVSVPSDTNNPNRKSVENLMDQLTRGQAPPPPQSYGVGSYDVYSTGDEYSSSQAEPVMSNVPPPPLPPKPEAMIPVAHVSPSPPRVQTQHRSQARESPIGPATHGSGRRDKDVSPVPRGGLKGAEARVKGNGAKNKNQLSPAPTQNIVFDVSQPLEEIQTPRDAVKSTAIALVKVDSTFLPGTTIGATHWVAYAMTRGRIRVISRSSGDRTLLTLPPPFSVATTVTDMAVYRNRLAGVTSDGGFVVWNLPDVITDDVPGQVVLCVLPSNDREALHSVKWHPKEPETLAVASENKIYLLNVMEASHSFGSEAIAQADLDRISHVFTMSSALISFDFDVPDYALATISEDSTLTLWNIRDSTPFWSSRIKGDDMPSSITLVDHGVIIGRRNGTIFQLLPIMSKNVLSTLKFVNGDKDDPDMFGHANYDSRIQTLWIANNRRESMVAVKLNFELLEHAANGDEVRGSFDRMVEFGGPKATIHFVILTAGADPHGDEAHAACVAAKVPPGELALVAFSVHSGGVDQVLIRKEWYDSALMSITAKFPYYSPPGLATAYVPPQASQAPLVDMRPQGQRLSSQMPAGPAAAPTRNKTPPSEEVDSEHVRDEGRPVEPKGKGTKGKNVGWKDNDNGKEKEKDKNGKADQANVSDSPVPAALSKEIKKLEDNLQTRIGRLLGKELDKQQQRFEEVRANDQAADFARQEKILKLISNELTKNTTRVVEAAVKNEVQCSVLPSLENITKIEVKNLINGQMVKSVTDAVKQSLPNEIEKMLLRPDVSNHFARSFSSAVTPLIEKHVKDAMAKTLIPAYSQQTAAVHQELSREIHSEILNMKKEMISWQSEAYRSQESVIRDLEQTVKALSDQVKFLSMNSQLSPGNGHQGMQTRSSPASSGSQHPQGPMNQYVPSHLRQTSLSSVNPSAPYGSGYQPAPVAPAAMKGWLPGPIAAPQASHPASLPPPPPPPPVLRHSPPAQIEDWDEAYLHTLSSTDPRQLHDLLARSNPEVVMPLNGQPGPLSQAVVLTLVHRLAATVGEMSPIDELFKASLWWLQRAASTLNTNDPLISPYIARVLPNVQQMLNTTKQRIDILPAGSPHLLDTARTISDIQDTLGRKPM